MKNVLGWLATLALSILVGLVVQRGWIRLRRRRWLRAGKRLGWKSAGNAESSARPPGAASSPAPDRPRDCALLTGEFAGQQALLFETKAMDAGRAPQYAVALDLSAAAQRGAAAPATLDEILSTIAREDRAVNYELLGTWCFIDSNASSAAEFFRELPKRCERLRAAFAGPPSSQSVRSRVTRDPEQQN
ncbi:MAG: hypothetical protein ACKVX7_05520 [Planctomycetota bacterium]